jgi:hypothetical protein
MLLCQLIEREKNGGLLSVSEVLQFNLIEREKNGGLLSVS